MPGEQSNNRWLKNSRGAIRPPGFFAQRWLDQCNSHLGLLMLDVMMINSATMITEINAPFTKNFLTVAGYKEFPADRKNFTG